MSESSQTATLRRASMTTTTATLTGTIGDETITVTVPRPVYYQISHALPYEGGQPYHLAIMNFDPRTPGADLSTLRGRSFEVYPNREGLAALAALEIPDPRPVKYVALEEHA